MNPTSFENILIPSGWELRPYRSLISKDDKFWTGITWQECGKNLDGVWTNGLIVVRPRIAASPNAPGYRAILCGEILDKNDEFCPIGSIEWRKVMACVGDSIEKSDEGFFRRKVESKKIKMPDIHVSYTSAKECPFDSKTNDPPMNPKPFKIICVNKEHRKLVLKFLLVRGYKLHIYGNVLDAEKYCETFRFADFPHIGHNMASCRVGEVFVFSEKQMEHYEKIPTIHLHEIETYIPPEPVIEIGDLYRTAQGNRFLVGDGVIVVLNESGYISVTHICRGELELKIKCDGTVLVKRGVKIVV